MPPILKDQRDIRANLPGARASALLGTFLGSAQHGNRAESFRVAPAPAHHRTAGRDRRAAPFRHQRLTLAFVDLHRKVRLGPPGLDAYRRQARLTATPGAATATSIRPRPRSGPHLTRQCDNGRRDRCGFTHHLAFANHPAVTVYCTNACVFDRHIQSYENSLGCSYSLFVGAAPHDARPIISLKRHDPPVTSKPRWP